MSSRRLVLRVLVAAVALAPALLILAWRSDRVDCESAGARVVALRKGPAAQLDSALANVRANCRGTVLPLAASATLVGAGDHRRAAALAREATRAEPSNFTAWAALYTALQPSDPRGAAAARARAERLSPLSVRADP